MMGPSHRIAGVVAWLGLAPTLHQTPWQHLLVGGLVAGAFAHGKLSPDVDQPLGWHHRGVTHFWLWPLLAFMFGHAYAHAHVAQTHITWTPWAATVIYGIAIAWGSHTLTDGIFGRIPIWPRLRRRRFSGFRSPRWHYVGFGLETGGFIENYLAPLVWAGLTIVFVTVLTLPAR